MSYAIGKRTRETCREMMDKFYDRVKLPFPFEPIELYTDGNDDYTVVLLENYPETCMKYGQLIKIKKGGKLVNKEKRVIFGDVSLNDIETTNVENHNGILRERNGRLVRKTKCHSKLKSRLEYSIELFQCYWNFMWGLKDRDNKTPEMLENILDCRWSWNNFFNFRLNILN